MDNDCNPYTNAYPQVTTIDEVLNHHNDFLDTCLKECMLTSPFLLKVRGCICCVFAMYLLCIFCVFPVYLLCICYVFAVYLLCMYEWTSNGLCAHVHVLGYTYSI